MVPFGTIFETSVKCSMQVYLCVKSCHFNNIAHGVLGIGIGGVNQVCRVR